MDLSLPASRGRFTVEEWEEWMDYDGVLQALSPRNATTSPTSTLHFTPSIDDESIVQHDDGLRKRSPPTVEYMPTPRPSMESKKRKSSDISDKGPGQAKLQQREKTSHNVIEKRYRSNLNDKISRLRDSVPDLRAALKRRSATKGALSESEGSDDGEGRSSGVKFNKATVMAKATEYIQRLEKQNRNLAEENQALRDRLNGVHRLPSTSTALSSEQIKSTNSSPSQMLPLGLQIDEALDSRINPDSVVGLIQVPEAFRLLKNESMQAPQSHYAPEPARPVLRNAELEFDNEGANGPRRRVMSKVLLGSLAGLMIMEGLSEKDGGNKQNKKEKRGLFALPRELLVESRGFRDPIRRRILEFMSSSRFPRGLPILRFSLLVVFLSCVLFVYLVWPRSNLSTKEKAGSDSQASSETTGETNQNAEVGFLPDDVPTAPTTNNSRELDTVLVAHSLREFFARQAIGLMGHSWLPGDTKDEEVASFPSLNSEEFKRRWKTYAHLLPKLLGERQTD